MYENLGAIGARDFFLEPQDLDIRRPAGDDASREEAAGSVSPECERLELQAPGAQGPGRTGFVSAAWPFGMPAFGDSLPVQAQVHWASAVRPPPASRLSTMEISGSKYVR